MIFMHSLVIKARFVSLILSFITDCIHFVVVVFVFFFSLSALFPQAIRYVQGQSSSCAPLRRRCLMGGLEDGCQSPGRRGGHPPTPPPEAAQCISVPSHSSVIARGSSNNDQVLHG